MDTLEYPTTFMIFLIHSIIRNYDIIQFYIWIDKKITQLAHNKNVFLYLMLIFI